MSTSPQYVGPALAGRNVKLGLRGVCPERFRVYGLGAKCNMDAQMAMVPVRSHWAIGIT